MPDKNEYTMSNRLHEFTPNFDQIETVEDLKSILQNMDIFALRESEQQLDNPDLWEKVH